MHLLKKKAGGGGGGGGGGFLIYGSYGSDIVYQTNIFACLVCKVIFGILVNVQWSNVCLI